MWGDTHSDILTQFVRTRDLGDEDARIVLGVALLTGLSEPFSSELDALKAGSHTLDTRLLSQILDVATTQQLAGVLWSPIGLHLSVEHFALLLGRIFAEDTDVRTLQLAVGGAVDFLRFHPGAFLLPEGMLRRLLESPDRQSRIIALKGVLFSKLPAEVIVKYLIHSLESANAEEGIGGLYCLGELLEKADDGILEAVEPSTWARLNRSLQPWTEEDDYDLRKTAEVRRNMLQMLIARLAQRNKVISRKQSNAGGEPAGQ